MRYVSLFVLAAFVMSGCGRETLTGVAEPGSSAAVTSEAAAKHEVKMVPVKGTFDGYSWPDFSRLDCPAGTVPLAGTGGGRSTLLGHYHLKTASCSYGLVDPTNPTFFGVDTLTAANGDKVFSTFSGYFTSEVDYVHIETIVGGTGRFVNASGMLTAYGKSTPQPAGASLKATFEGEVSPVGSSR